MNLELKTLRDSDESLCNVLHAYGPGEGLARMLVVLRDAASIAAYGEYPQAQDFPTAADYADLLTQAQAYLDAHKTPRMELEAAAAFPAGSDPALRVGDTVRVADPRSGLIVTTRIEELSCEIEPGGAISYGLYLGSDAPSLIDEVLDTPEAEERRKAALGLPIPTVRVRPGKPGLVVTVAAFGPNSSASGVEIHVSATKGFSPDNSTLAARGNQTRYELSNLQAGTRYYVRARAYDAQGRYGEYSAEATAVAGTVGQGDLDPGLSDAIDNAAAAAAVVDANKATWDLARLVTRTTLIGGNLSGAGSTTLTDSSKDFAALDVQPNMYVRLLSGAGVGQMRVITAVAGSTITIDPAWDVIPSAGDGYEISSDSRITSREQGSIVAKLNRAPDDPTQFTSIRQNADAITLTAAVLDPFAFSDDADTVIVDNDGSTWLVSSQPAYAEGSDSKGQFSSLSVTPWSITSIVSTLSQAPDAPTQYSAIRQLVDEIDLRVRSDEVISSINLSPEGVRISGQKIQLNGDVAVTGNVDITNSSQSAYSFRVKSNSNALKAVVGNTSGLSDGRGGSLPSGTYGIWLGPDSVFTGKISTATMIDIGGELIYVGGRIGSAISVNPGTETTFAVLDLALPGLNADDWIASLVAVSLRLPNGVYARAYRSGTLVYDSSTDSMLYATLNRGTRQYLSSSYVFNPAKDIEVRLYNSNTSVVILEPWHMCQLVFLRYAWSLT